MFLIDQAFNSAARAYNFNSVCWRNSKYCIFSLPSPTLSRSPLPPLPRSLSSSPSSASPPPLSPAPALALLITIFSLPSPTLSRARARSPLPPSPALQLWSGESDLWSQGLHSLTALSQHTFTLCFTLLFLIGVNIVFTFYFIALCYIICAKSFFT